MASNVNVKDMTEGELLRHIQAGASNLWRLTPATMAHHLSEGQWIPAIHLMYISQIAASAIYNSLEYKVPSFTAVSIPPRHGKSELLSIHTPPWIFDSWPWAQIMLLGYGAELMTDFSRKARDFSIAHEDQLNFKVRPDLRKADEWGTTKGGMLRSLGIGGSITGRGAHLLLVDDYIKNAQEATSPAHLEHLIEWFKSTAFTRREPGAAVFIVATRWAPKDLIGALGEIPEIKWNVINLPAIATGEQDPLGRAKGDPLWEERYTKEQLHQIKATLGSHWWEALYQQQPRDYVEGEFASGVPKIVSMPDKSRLVLGRAWDFAATDKKAAKKKKRSDYTVTILAGYHVDEDRVYLLDLVRERWSPGEVDLHLKGFAEKDGHEVLIWTEEEGGSSGKTVSWNIQNRILKGYKVEPIHATGPKELRAQPAFAGAERGDLVMVKGDWNDILRNEIVRFPNGEHDDCIDPMGLVYNQLVKRFRRKTATWGRADVRGRQPVRPLGMAVSTRRATFGRHTTRR